MTIIRRSTDSAMQRKGWTSISKALEGAAAYLSSGYIHSKYKQNTIFKLRYTPNKGSVASVCIGSVLCGKKLGENIRK